MSGPAWSSASELGEDFSGSALRLAGVCALALGWSPDAFWRATPAEVGAITAVLAPPGARPLGAAEMHALQETIDG